MLIGILIFLTSLVVISVMTGVVCFLIPYLEHKWPIDEGNNRAGRPEFIDEFEDWIDDKIAES